MPLEENHGKCMQTKNEWFHSTFLPGKFSV